MIVVDIETSGLHPMKHSIIDIGAVHMESGYTFHVECIPGKDKEFDENVTKINGVTKDAFYSREEYPYVPQHIAALYFVDWCKNIEQKDKGIVLAGQNLLKLDIPFIAYALCGDIFGDEFWNVFSHRTVDIHSMALAQSGKSMSSNEIAEYNGVPSEIMPHTGIRGAEHEKKIIEALLRIKDES